MIKLTENSRSKEVDDHALFGLTLSLPLWILVTNFFYFSALRVAGKCFFNFYGPVAEGGRCEYMGGINEPRFF